MLPSSLDVLESVGLGYSTAKPPVLAEFGPEPAAVALASVSSFEYPPFSLPSVVEPAVGIRQG